MPPELQKELSMLMSPPVIAGVVTWLVSQIVMIILMINHKPKNRKVDEAVRRGHVVKAYITGRVDRLNRPEEGSKGRLTYVCDYKYMVDGKRMVYQYQGYTMPPEPLTLYYIDDPKKVFPGENINNYWRDMAGLRRALIYIVPLLLGAGVMLAMGGVPI